MFSFFRSRTLDGRPNDTSHHLDLIFDVFSDCFYRFTASSSSKKFFCRKKIFFFESKLCLPRRTCQHWYQNRHAQQRNTKKNFRFQNYLPHFSVHPTSGPGVFRFRPWISFDELPAGSTGPHFQENRGQPVRTFESRGANRSILSVSRRFRGALGGRVWGAQNGLFYVVNNLLTKNGPLNLDLPGF